MNQKKGSSGILLAVVVVCVLAYVGVEWFTSGSSQYTQHDKLIEYQQRAAHIQSLKSSGTSTATDDAELDELNRRIGSLKADGVK